MKKILLLSLLLTQLTIHANQVANPASNNAKEEALAFTAKQNSLVQSLSTELKDPVNQIANLTVSHFVSLDTPFPISVINTAGAWIPLSTNLSKLFVEYIRERLQIKVFSASELSAALKTNFQTWIEMSTLTEAEIKKFYSLEYMFPNLHTNLSHDENQTDNYLKEHNEILNLWKKQETAELEQKLARQKETLLAESLRTAKKIPLTVTEETASKVSYFNSTNYAQNYNVQFHGPTGFEGAFSYGENRWTGYNAKFPLVVQQTLPSSQLAPGTYPAQGAYWDPISQVFYFRKADDKGTPISYSIDYPEENFSKLVGVDVSKMTGNAFVPKLVPNASDETQYYTSYAYAGQFTYQFDDSSVPGYTLQRFIKPLYDLPKVTNQIFKIKLEMLKKNVTESQAKIKTLFKPLINSLNAYAKIKNIIQAENETARRILEYAFQGIISCFYSLKNSATLMETYKEALKPVIIATPSQIDPTVIPDAVKDDYILQVLDYHGIVAGQPLSIAQTIYFILYGAFPKQLQQALTVLGLKENVFQSIQSSLNKILTQYFIWIPETKYLPWVGWAVGGTWTMRIDCAGCLTLPQLIEKLEQAIEDAINILIEGLNKNMQIIKTLSEQQ